jgi:hypothetical protein
MSKVERKHGAAPWNLIGDILASLASGCSLC